MHMDMLILVDDDDNAVGCEEKETCHVLPTRLHRAFSIFIVNAKGEMLIHRRSEIKKTWPGFWTNACCSHPREGESLDVATQRRLQEELGFNCPLRHLFRFRYQARYDGNYGEDEVDHVFIGVYEGPVRPDPEEIAEWKFVAVEELQRDIEVHHARYTPWFRIALPRVVDFLEKNS
jgi:isopentenyl-diphosphate delta-isomerase